MTDAEILKELNLMEFDDAVKKILVELKKVREDERMEAAQDIELAVLICEEAADYVVSGKSAQKKSDIEEVTHE